MKNKKGFTVVELLITILALGILAVLSLSIGENVTSNSRITGVINNFLADFSQAKLLAASENRYVTIEFSPDGGTYIIQKQTDVSNTNNWTLVKTVQPLSGRVFYNLGDVSDFAVNSTGEVRLLPINVNADPSPVTLVFYIRKGSGRDVDPIVFQRTVQIFPFGGIKVEKN